jgi:hypothetical protein
VSRAHGLVDHGNSTGPQVHRGHGPTPGAELTLSRGSGHGGSPVVGKDKAGAWGIITVVSEGGGAAQFGPAVGRRRWQP